MGTYQANRSFLTRFAWMSVTAAIATIGLKTAAYILTGSVGLLSDANESIVNLVGALGHSKAEYFSSGVEGGLIVIAAISIAATAIRRLINPQPIEQIGLGLGISVLASLINLGVSIVLSRAGKRYQSITLEADARHLMTDVWTSAGVLVGVGAVALTGLERLDPIVALVVAGNIVWSGVNIMRRSVSGLMDTALPQEELDKIQGVLKIYKQEGIQIHALRTRQSGARRFVSFHVLVPGNWSVQYGHQLLERIEADLRRSLTNLSVFTHLEPLDDPVSWQDTDLDREDTPPDAPEQKEV
jgi:cation diffusion facilitator family transporter